MELARKVVRVHFDTGVVRDFDIVLEKDDGTLERTEDHFKQFINVHDKRVRARIENSKDLDPEMGRQILDHATAPCVELHVVAVLGDEEASRNELMAALFN